MNKRLKSKEKMNFLLQDKQYKKLHLFLYLFTVIVIVLFYFMSIIVFANYANTLITSIFSIIIGLTLVFHREKIVKIISNKVNDKKIKDYKENNKKGLKTTLRKITPKNKKFKLNITSKTTIKEKVLKFSKKFSPKEKSKEKKGYVELK